MKILFPPADDRIAERISKMLGLGKERKLVAASGNPSNKSAVPMTFDCSLPPYEARKGRQVFGAFDHESG